MTATTLPPVQPCCQKHHSLPFQHVRVYQNKRGHTKHAYECARCFRTLPERGLRPSNIRWSLPGSPYCEQCEQENDEEIDAALESVRARVAGENQLPLFAFTPKRDGL